MSVGSAFFIIALVFFFLAGLPQNLLAYSACVSWGLFSLTLGILLNGVSLRGVVRQ